jgi:hypothetical protein
MEMRFSGNLEQLSKEDTSSTFFFYLISRLKCDFNKQGQLKSAKLLNQQGKIIQTLREGFLQYYFEDQFNRNNTGIFCNFEYISQGELKTKIRTSNVGSLNVLSDSMIDTQFHSDPRTSNLTSSSGRGSWGLDEFSKVSFAKGKFMSQSTLL